MCLSYTVNEKSEETTSLCSFIFESGSKGVLEGEEVRWGVSL